MKKMNVFVPITKIDEEKRLVYGLLAEEAIDKSGEIFDYESSKPYVKQWSEYFKNATATTGQAPSEGNLRSMHTNKPAGKFISVECDDVAKNVPVCGYVGDDEQWRATMNGERTGFSLGGSYVKRWKDEATGAIRYTAKIAEGSLVDNPCMYGATFTAIKADGASELRKFAKHDVDDVAKTADELSKSIDAFLEKHAPGKFKKSLYDVCSLADVVMSLQSVIMWCESDAFFEGDTAPGLDQLKQALSVLGAALLAMTAEEVAELTGGDPGLEMAMNADDLKKFSDTAAEAVTKALAPVVENITKLQDATKPEALVKTVQDGVAKTITESLTKSFTETVAKAVEPLAKAAEMTAISDRVKKLEDLPAPVGNPISKTLRGSNGADQAPTVVDVVGEVIAKATAAGATKEQTDAMRMAAATRVLQLSR